ncbi:MAG TPA: hypothetical protein VGV60_02000 [Candidatus Polarisedimenticolia bacterium]|nr:hypothetical protein [Candidatus Polarisedimenticolia bacterium]
MALFHVGWGGARDYRKAHVPGALHFDTGRIERPPLWRLVDDAELERALLSLGVTRTAPSLYGKPTMAATRVALVLLYAGVQDVRILDGCPYSLHAHRRRARRLAGAALRYGSRRATQPGRFPSAPSACRAGSACWRSWKT